jgi:cysteine synthase B
LQPTDGSAIPGIRRWSEAYLPKIFERERIDRILDIDQAAAETTMRELAAREGILCGVSSGGAVAGALQLSQELDKAREKNSSIERAVIVAIICDRGDRYLSTGVFDAALE